MESHVTHRIAFLAGLYSLIGGIVSLSGWVLDIRFLTNWENNGISIQPNATVCAIFSGIGLLALAANRTRILAACGAAVLTIGGLTLLQWVGGLSFGIDGLLLFEREWGRVGVVVPGRMGPPGSLSWTLIGAALVLSASPRTRLVVPALGLSTALISGLSLVGYFYQVDQLYALPRFTVIAFQTSTFVMAVSIGIIASHREREPMRMLLDPGGAGMLARRALPLILLAPIVVGFLRVKGQNAGLYDTGLGSALTSLIIIGVLAALMWWVLNAVRVREQALGESLSDTQLLHRLAMDMANPAEPEELYERIMDAAVEIMHSDFASIQMYHRVRENEGELQLLAHRRFRPEAVAYWKRVGRDSGSVCAEAFRTGQRQLVPDTERCESIRGDDRTHLREMGVRAVQTTPLIARNGALIGMISTHWKQPHEPRDRDWHMLEVLAKHTADLMERVKSEQTLRRHAETFASLVEQSPLGIYTVDSQFRIRNVSRGAMPAFRNVTPLIGRDFAEAMHIIWPDSFAHETIAIFRHTLQTGVPYISPGMTEKRHDLDAIESYEWQINRVTLDDGQYGVVCYFFNTTRLQQAQQALRDADRRKDEFLATLAHELRNPLAPVRNALQVLNLMGTDVRELQWARDVIDRQMKQMSRLIDDLMDVSRISQGKIELKRERVTLAKVIQGALETSRPLIEQCGHELTVTVPPQTLYLDADLTRLDQVLSNLLNNAAKYTERGGRIWLTVERQGSDVVASVKDSGIGIPREKLQSVFELFSQVQGTLERSQGGLGIGLSLVKRLVEMHGGSIDVHSPGIGQGSEFVVRLPVVIEPTPAAHRQDLEESEVWASSLRILIVDDNRDAADSLGLMLQMIGNETQTAYDGVGAVQAAEAFQPKVVLLDIGLPKLNGYDACRQIRQQPWGKKMALIAMTGWGQEEDKRKAEDAGFDRHLVKPVDPRELIKLLRSLPAGQTNVPDAVTGGAECSLSQVLAPS
jgi:signal transduction histidine kinase/CheY-like chemotaxis protein